MSYCCTRNVASIIKSHNKRLINTSIKNTLPCNCRKNPECPLDCINTLPQQTGTLTKFVQILQKVISNSVFTTTGCHLTTRDTPKIQHFCLGSKEEAQDNAIPDMVPNQICTSLIYVCKKNLKLLITPIRINCFSKRSELISKWRHVNKFLQPNYKSNDQTFRKMSHLKYIMTFQLLSKQ